MHISLMMVLNKATHYLRHFIVCHICTTDWFDGTEIICRKCATLLPSIFSRAQHTTALSSEFVAFHIEIRFIHRIWVPYECHSSYLFNKPRKNVDDSELIWLPNKAKSNVWLVESRRNNGGNKWMPLLVEKNHYRPDPNCNYVYVWIAIVAKLYGSMDSSHRLVLVLSGVERKQ